MSNAADDYKNFTDSEEVLFDGGAGFSYYAARPAKIDYANDKDAWQGKFNAGGEYFVRVDSAQYLWPRLLMDAGISQPRIEVWQPAGGYASPDSELQGADFDLKIFKPTVSGTYFVIASYGGFGGSQTGEYVVSVGDVSSIPELEIIRNNLSSFSSLSQDLEFEFAGQVVKGRGTAILSEVSGTQRTFVTDFNFSAPSASRIAVDGEKVTLNPPADLKPNTDYVVTFREDFVQNLAGVSSKAQELSFTTAAGSSSAPPAQTAQESIISVIVAPGILATAPIYLDGLRELREPAPSRAGEYSSWLVEYEGVSISFPTIAQAVMIATRNGDFTSEFRQEIREVPGLESYANLPYGQIVELVGQLGLTIDQAMLAVAGADGNFVG